MTWNLCVTAGVVESEGSLGGLRIGAGFVQGLGIIDLVVLHLWMQLCELLVTFCRGAEILDVIITVTQQRQGCPGLEHMEAHRKETVGTGI